MKNTIKELYPYQEKLAKEMYTIGSCLNRSFGGAGKTVTSFEVASLYESSRNLVIVPNPKLMVKQWVKEGQRFAPWYTYYAIKGTPRQREEQLKTALSDPKPIFLVMSYEVARIELETLRRVKWGCVFADEAHRMKNITSKTWKAITKIDCYRKYALTATPVLNSALDMYGIMAWLRPGLLGNYWGFLKVYVVKDFFGAVKYFRNMDQLARIVAPYIVNVTQEEAGLQLPAITHTDLTITLSDKERKLYDTCRKELWDDLQKGDLDKLSDPIVMENTLTQIGKLQELVDSMELLGEHTDSSKLDVLKECLEDTDPGEKVVIITRFKRMAYILERELAKYKPLLITGDTRNSGDVVEVFEKNPEHRILIGTEAISQGVDKLQTASIMYNYDQPWNKGRYDQRIWRVHRNGQTKPVFIYNLLVEKSIDTWIAKKIINKDALAKKLLREDIEEILNG